MREPSELDAYDRMYEKIQLMRVIASGALSVLEDHEMEFFSLLKDQRKLHSAFSDLSTAILLMWKIVMQDSEEIAHNLASL